MDQPLWFLRRGSVNVRQLAPAQAQGQSPLLRRSEFLFSWYDIWLWPVEYVECLNLLTYRMILYRGFPKSGYPPNHPNFSRIFPYNPSILECPHLSNPPYSYYNWHWQYFVFGMKLGTTWNEHHPVASGGPGTHRSGLSDCVPMLNWSYLS